MEVVVPVLLGVAVGAVIGALGAGGSILAIPALVYGAGRSVREAVPASLLVVGVAAASGLVPHLRSRHVVLRSGSVFAAAGIGGTVLGAYAGRRVADEVLLTSFSALMIVVALGMVRNRRSETQPEPVVDPSLEVTRLLALLGTGFLVGTMTGFFGVGGGFLIVPALVLLLGYDPKSAVGTSLLVIIVNSASGLLAHILSEPTKLRWVLPFAATAGLAAAAGGRLSVVTSGDRLRYGFAALIVAVAAFVLSEVWLLDLQR